MEKLVKGNKKILIGVVAFILAVVTAATFIVKINSKTATLDAALRRAQNYEQLTDNKTYYLDNEGEITTNECEYVKFEAYYANDLDNDGYAEKMLGSCKEIGSSDTMYLNIAVEQEGSLKNGKITFSGNNTAYSMKALKDSLLKENYVFSNVKSRDIEFNRIDAGMSKLVTAISSASITNAESYSGTNKIIFTGTYVDSDSNEHEIKREIEFTNDWYGTARASLSNLSNSVDYFTYAAGSNKGINASFTLSEIYGKLIPSASHVEIEMAELAGEYPVNVTCQGGTYDPTTHKLTIDRDTTNRSEMYNINIRYSDEVYNAVSTDISYNGYTISMPISAYYVCSNNPNEEFENPYTTATVSSNIYVNFTVSNGMRQGYVFSESFEDTQSATRPSDNKSIEVLPKKEFIDAYNTDDEDEQQKFEYKTSWHVRKSVIDNSEMKIIMRDSNISGGANYGDQLSGNWLQKYMDIKKIYFENNRFIGKDYTLKVYDNDTDELIKEFTTQEIANCKSDNPYELESGVKHIRIETYGSVESEVNSVLNVYMVKEIDLGKIKQDFTREQVEEMEELKTTIAGVIEPSAGTATEPLNGSSICYLETEKNYAKITLQTTEASTLSKLNEKIHISVLTANTIYSKWKDGIFVVEVPSQITNIKINSITANGNLRVEGYDTSVEGGKRLIRIYTSNSMPTSNFTITIDADMNIDPRTASCAVPFNLYAYNDLTQINYYNALDVYDINGNGNRNESVFKNSTNLNLYSEASFVTLETLTNYDNEGSVNIAPNIANIKNNVNSAKVNVEIVNNFAQRVDSISILGKIPFEGNTYIGGSSLGSKFTATMKNTGISVQNELANYAKVYYSTEENPTKDLNDSSNGWTLKENVTSFDDIRSYLIVLENYVLNPGYGYEFSYDINVPNDVDINDAAYSCHMVYYDLITDEGKISYTVQPSKLGLRVVDYYDLELTKVKENTDLRIQGATYLVTEVLPANADPDLAPETQVAVSTADGKLNFKDLRINQEYTLKEIRASGNYELSDIVRTFKLEKGNNGALNLVTDIDFDGEVTVTGGGNQKAKVTSIVEDVPKIELTITKYDRASGNPMKGVTFLINGERYNTNAQGVINVDGVSFGKTCTLKEIYSNGYYLDDTEYEFVINKDSNNNITITSENSDIAAAGITNSPYADLVSVSFALYNDKIPTYDLKIIKINERTNELSINETLEGAKFILNKVDDGNREVLTTNDNGEAIASNLYQRVNGKNITGQYVLQETEAPAGFSNNKEEIKFVVFENEENSLEVAFENDEYETLASAEFEGDTLVLTIKDKPLFIVRKVDEKTNEPLPFAEFVIYEIDMNGNNLGYAKDANGDYIGELNENGQYIVKTNLNGYLSAPLRDGSYKIVEVKAPEGYKLNSGAEIFTITQGNKYHVDRYDPEVITEIYTVEDLLAFKRSVENNAIYAGVTVRLMNDIDFNDPNSYRSGEVNSSFVESGNGSGFSPIGNDNASFNGTFDGQGHVLKNLYINETFTDSDQHYLGFFRAINNATIKNFGIESGTIKSKKTNWGGEHVGSIVGSANYSKIYNCYNKANIEVNITYYSGGTLYGGGISGYPYNLEIINCYNRGNITIQGSSNTYLYVGGVVGRYDASGSTFKSVYNTGSISYPGITSSSICVYPVGNLGSKSSNCYYDLSVESSFSRADLSVGMTAAEMKTSDFVATLGTDNWMMDENSENDGYPVLGLYNVSATYIEEIKYIEDLLDLSIQIQNDIKYEKRTIRLANDLDFQDVNSYKDATDTSYGDLNGDGNVEGIKDELTTGKGFTPIGGGNDNITYYFCGIFEGQGHEIKNLYMNSSDSKLGLFATCQNACIKDLTVSGEITRNMTSDHDDGVVGGIVASASNSSILNCVNKVNIKVTGEKTSSWTLNISGIAGRASQTNIKYCGNLGNITLDFTATSWVPVYASGICADNYDNTGDQTKDCYNRGKIESKCVNVSGIYLSGIARKLAINSYNTGDIICDASTESNTKIAPICYDGQTTNSYYLSTANINATYDDLSTSKTEAEMKSNEFVSQLGRSWKADTTNTNDGYPIPKQQAVEFVSEIYYIEDLVKLSEYVNTIGLCPDNSSVKLMRDLDFNDDNSYLDSTDTSFGDINEDGTVQGIKDELTTGKGFIPIGSNCYGFTGEFDGQNHQIKNLHIDRPETQKCGLFGLAFNAEFRNLTISGNINTNSYAGGLVGTVANGILMENCTNYCNITGGSSSYVGGLIGYGSGSYSPFEKNNFVINNCKNYGEINGYYAGGLSGQIYSFPNVSFNDFTNNGNITSTYYSAGLVGYISSNSSLTMKNCVNNGKVEGTGNYVGGFFGDCNGGSTLLEKCVNNGKVVCAGNSTYYGGGFFAYTSAYPLTIDDCCNNGDIELTSNGNSSIRVGGIIGYTYTNCTFLNTYNTGNINGSTTFAEYAGGIIGYCSGSPSFSACYNLGTIYNAIYMGGIVGGQGSPSFYRCYNAGDIIRTESFSSSSTNYTGGISGYGGKSFYQCYNLGNINLDNINATGTTYVGGIVPSGSGSYCYNKGNITVNSKANDIYVGGITGSAYSNTDAYTFNTGDITVNHTGSYAYVGGIIATGGAVYSYNTGDITYNHNMGSSSYHTLYLGGISGSSSSSSVTYSYNTGNITNNTERSTSTSAYVGGIIGSASSGSPAIMYNTGNIENNIKCGSTSSSSIYAGGLIGSTSSTLAHAYNTGSVHTNVETTDPSSLYTYAGGIIGSGGNVVYAYNTGDVINNPVSGYNYADTNGLVGSGGAQGTPRFLLDTAKVIGPASSTEKTMTIVSDEELKSDEVYNQLSGTSNWKKVDGAYPILEFQVYAASEEAAAEITVNDEKIKYDITAEIGENIDGIRIGGSTSGEYNDIYVSNLYKKLVESVDHGDSNAKDITITPDSGYEVTEVTINGETYSFNADDFGVVTIPAGYFTNVKTNYNIVARFAPVDEVLTINKVDENENAVGGAVFDIQEIETREIPTGVTRELVQNGQMTSYSKVSEDSILGPLTVNAGYYFTQDSDGVYKATNTGANTKADSYMKIDLTNMSKDYYIKVYYKNVVSTYNANNGYVSITSDTTPAYTNTSGRFVSVYGNSTYNQTSSKLTHGNIYYLHMAQTIGSSSLSSGQGFQITKIEVLEVVPVQAYSFDQDESTGKYVSNNSTTLPTSTTATAYVPVDLTGRTGKYNIVINNEISGTNHAGGIVVSESVSRVTSSYSGIAGISKSGTEAASDFSVPVDGGKMYYVHMYHSNYSSTTNIYNDNTLTINSINVTLNDASLYHISGVTTDGNGKARVNLRYGKYAITETSAPEGYTKSNVVVEHIIGENTNNNVEFVNESKKKVVSHYYLKNTGEEYNVEPVRLSEDEISFGDLNDEYVTNVYTELGDLNLVRDEGEYVIPENASGKYQSAVTNVYYYYEGEIAPYKVHYIYGENEDVDALVEGEAEVGTEITTYEEKNKPGYKFKETINLPLTVSSTVDDNNIYVIYEKDEFDYTVKYFYQNLNGEYEEAQDKEETYSALFESEISDYEDKVTDGFKLNRAVALDENGEEKELPLVITADSTKNIIEVFYERDNINYTVHYFYQNVENVLMSTTKQAMFGSSITEQDVEDKNIEGYKLDRIKRIDDNNEEQDLPLVISADPDKNVINVYYIKDNFGYKVKYFYEKLDDSGEYEEATDEEENLSAEFESQVTSVPEVNHGREGYVKDRVETLPLTITAIPDNNIINVYYNRATIGYTVKYFYEKLDVAGEYEEATSEQEDLSAAFGTVINESDIPTTGHGRDGYVRDRIVTVPFTITATATDNVINVYYIRDTFEYTVHYFYQQNNGEYVEDTTKKETKSAAFGTEISTYDDKVTDGYKFKEAKTEDKDGTFGSLPLVITDNKDNNKINVYYILTYTINTEVAARNGTNHNGTSDTEKGGTISGENDNPYETVERGASNTKSIAVEAAEGFVIKDIKVNGSSIDYSSYVQRSAAHKVVLPEGYFTNITESKVVTAEFKKASDIKVRYMINGTETSLYTDATTGESFIKYEGFEGDNFETEFKTFTGYKLNSITDQDGTVLTGTNNVISGNMYADELVVTYWYELDTFGYTVRYFYEKLDVAGEYEEATNEQENKTAAFGTIIKESDIPTTGHGRTGYERNRIETVPFTVTEVAGNNVINVYYNRSTYGYTIKYFYEKLDVAGQYEEATNEQENKTAAFGTIIKESDIPTTGHGRTGYERNRIETVPFTVTEVAGNNVINVYYNRSTYGYTIKYFYEKLDAAGEYEEATNEQENRTAAFGTVINQADIPTTGHGKTGYKRDRIVTVPLTITENAEDNIINVYYIRDGYRYQVKYFYEKLNAAGEYEEATEEEETLSAAFGTRITTVPTDNHGRTGYKRDRVETLPFTVTANEENNIINVYYVRDTYGYTIKYFYEKLDVDGEYQEEVGERITEEAAFGTVIEESDVPTTGHGKDGYDLNRIETVPLTVSEVADNNVINVYYNRNTYEYSVHYFYEKIEEDGEFEEDTSKVETSSAKFGAEISNYTDNVIPGYEFSEAKALNENGQEGDLPLVIKSDKTKNVINVYYIKEGLGYTVHYFYDGVEDPLQVQNKNSTIGAKITEYEDKSSDEYRLDKVRALDENGEEAELPLVIKVDESKNVINVYYVHNTGKVVVKYVDNLTGETIAEDVTLEGNIESPYTVTRVDNIPGHRLDLDNLPTNENGRFKKDEQTVTYKYIELKEYELLVRYSAGTSEIDPAKIAVRFGDTFIDEYTTNGELKIGNLELTDLGTVTYTVYESETPEYCDTIVSEESPAVVELTRRLNTEENRYEFVANYVEIEGFNVIIDDVNRKVIFDITTEKNEKYDLALRKFITKIGDKSITDREPKVEISADNKISYITNSNIEQAINNQEVTYTIRMYNESEVRAKGKRVIEQIPDGLVFVPGNEINKQYGWIMCKADNDGNIAITENPEEANIVLTDYLDGASITAFDPITGTVNYLDVQAVFKVDESKITNEDRIIENKVQIMTNDNDDNSDNDVTTEKVYVKYFDLSVKKYIKNVVVDRNGVQETTEVGYNKKGELVKVDVKKSEVNNTKLTITYGLQVTNVGEIPGYATEITDYVPENFKLQDNGDWTLNGNKAVSTVLSDTLLNPGESATIEITFEWNLADGNIGVRRNEAEITAYTNDYDAVDITKDNKDGEDLLVSIKTGSEVIKTVSIFVMAISIVTLGAFFIKRKVVIRRV